MTKHHCSKCNDTGLTRYFQLQCDCPAGAVFAGEPAQPAVQAAAKAVSDARVLVPERELAELRRLVQEGATEIGRLSGENNPLRSENARLQRELEELQRKLDDLTDFDDRVAVETTLRERAELAEAQRDNLRNELGETSRVVQLLRAQHDDARTLAELEAAAATLFYNPQSSVDTPTAVTSSKRSK